MARVRDHAAEGAARRLRDVQRGTRDYGPAAPRWQRAGFPDESAYRTARTEARVWSKEHSQKAVSRYNPRSTPEEFRAYYNAFVSDRHSVQRSTPRRQAAFRHYLLASGYVTQREYEEKYPPPI